MLHDAIDRIACRARDITHNGALTADKAIGKRGFARVGTPDDRDAYLVVRLVITCILGKLAHDGIEKISRAMAMRGRNRHGIAKSKRVELPEYFIFAIRIVELVDGKHDWNLALEQHASDVGVFARHARTTINDKDDAIGLLAGNECLARDGTLEHVRIAKGDATCIDDHEIDAIPVGAMVRAITRHTAHLVHDGIFGLRYAINERGLSDIRTTDHGNERKTHENLFT